MSHGAREPEQPELPPDLAHREIRGLEHDDMHADAQLIGLQLPDQRARGVTFEGASFEQVNLASSRLEGLCLVDVQLVACDLANVQSPRFQASRVAISETRLTGIALNEAVLRDVTFRDCTIDLASFGFSRLTRVSFEECVLVESDSLEAVLESVRFLHCDLKRSDFRSARLKHCELRRSDLIGMQGVQSLRGAAMEWSDIIDMAPLWASALGIEILDRG